MIINNLKKYWIYYLCAAVMLVPVGIYSLYAVPAADDAYNSIAIRNLLEDNHFYFWAAVKQAYVYYLTVGGYYFSIFGNCIISPYLRGGIMGIRIAVLLLNTCFYLSVFILTRTFARTKAFDQKQVWILYIGLIFCMINNYMNPEIYTWYCISTVYLLPMAAMFFGLSAYLESQKGKRWFFLAVSSGCGFLASGGCLNIAAMNCGLYVLIAFYFIKKNNTKIYLLPALISIVGGLINLLAPGNYVRHNYTTEKYDVLKALADTFLLVWERYEYLFTKTAFLAVMVFLFFALFPHVKFDPEGAFTYKHPVVIGFLFLLGVLIVDFPVVFGYALEHRAMPDRGKFVQDTAIYLLSILWLFYFIGHKKMCHKRQISDRHINKPAIAAICVIFTLSVYGQSGADGWSTSYMIRSIISGDARKYSDALEKIMYDIQSSDNEDVVVQMESVTSNRLIKSTDLSNDANFWVNRTFAELFYKKSVVVESQ